MKIRTGFISNSSSASYVIRVGMPYKKLMETIYNEYAYHYFHKDSLTQKVDEKIRYLKQSLDDETEFLRKFYPIESIERDIKMYEEFKTNLETDKGRIDFYCYLHSIRIKRDDENPDTKTVIYLTTTMHNYFHENMSKLMQEIIMEGLFENKYNVECKVYHDMGSIYNENEDRVRF
jgi:hypothetical protein